MKKSLILAVAFSVLLLSFCAQKENGVLDKFTISPEKPNPGDSVAVSYNPQETELAASDKISMVSYFYSKGLPEAKETVMRRKNGGWNASLLIPEESCGALIKFQDDDIIDNNDKKGYIIHLYNEDGDPVPRTFAGLAEAYAGWGTYLLELEADQQEVSDLFQKEFTKNPELKKDYLFYYIRNVSAMEPTGGKEMAFKELDEIAENSDLNEEQLSTVVSLYKNFDETEKAEKFAQMIREMEPKGDFVQSEKFMEFYQAKDVNEKIALLQEFKKDFPDSENISMGHSIVCRTLAEKGEFERIKDYMKQNPGAGTWNLYNNVAFKMLEKKQNLGLATEFASMSVKLARAEITDPTEEKPSYYTEKEWMKTREAYLSTCLDTYGTLLLQMERPQEAQEVLSEAVRLRERKNSEFNEHYAQSLVESGDFSTALNEMERYLKSGKSTSKMKELFVTASIKQGRKKEEAEKALSELEGKGDEKLKAEIKKEMIDIPAPEFTLKNLEGETISLMDLRDKVVVLDFWATWCGPCVTSFPGMKGVVEKYNDDDSVELLFIDSWERVDDWASNAKNYITENEYPFHVLLDTENKVIDSYNVSGIPTKFFIDGQGRIRFKSVGFDGNTEKLVREVSLIIEMLK
jgi:thiol-disulfide isomerase/thioredoxin